MIYQVDLLSASESESRGGRKTHLFSRHAIRPFVTQSQNPRTALSEPFVSLLIILRYILVHLLESLRSSLDREQDLVLSIERDVRDGRHSLELGRELKSTFDGDRRGEGRVGSFVRGRGDLVS